jgi:hypothetical protein
MSYGLTTVPGTAHEQHRVTETVLGPAGHFRACDILLSTNQHKENNAKPTMAEKLRIVIPSKESLEETLSFHCIDDRTIDSDNEAAGQVRKKPTMMVQ